MTIHCSPCGMNNVRAFREFYARYVTRRAGVNEPRIADAFASVEREKFVGSGPWYVFIAGAYISTETDDPRVLYQDILVALSPDRGINNGEPSLHAKVIATASPQPGETVIHIGSGTGYYTALLAHLVGSHGRVHAYEIEADIAALATQNLAYAENVSVHATSGVDAALPLANVIYVSAGATHPPAPWLDALAIGGRLVLPLTPNERLGCMLLVTRRTSTAYAARIFSSAGFIPCIGARDEEASRSLAAALDSGDTDRVQSLRRSVTPDNSAWCIGTDWWLSTTEPRE
jgi:protein-L-isoaspartate(D-aspartate) O-methyltransferase